MLLRARRWLPAAMLSLAVLGCAAEEEASTDPEGLEEPGGAPEGVEGGEEPDVEPDPGEPAVEGGDGGRLTPHDEDDENEDDDENEGETDDAAG